jgi:hypothetical protein
MRRNYTPKVPHACEQCGRVVFYRPCEVQKFCSQACAHQSRVGKRTAPHVTRACPYCGTTFENLLSQIGVYCSMACCNAAKIQDVATRFWAKVDQSGDCWPFAVAGTDGYGKFWLNGRSVHASHVAYELTFGPIAAGVNVLHHCDNPICCNPQHLFAGSRSDNSVDMVPKGRHPRAILDARDVVAIRARYATGEKRRAIAESYNVSYATIDGVVNHRSWRCVA